MSGGSRARLEARQAPGVFRMRDFDDIVRVLTVVSAIFLPLTLVAGIFGMNFQYMPELGYRYGYFVALGGMLALAVVLLIIFRIKHWI